MPDKCKHYWCYVQAVHSGPRGGSLVRRYCTKCDIEQVGSVRGWREPRPDEFEDSAEEEAANV